MSEKLVEEVRQWAEATAAVSRDGVLSSWAVRQADARRLLLLADTIASLQQRVSELEEGLRALVEAIDGDYWPSTQRAHRLLEDTR